jgi:anaphase-promoting complex subunit 4
MGQPQDPEPRLNLVASKQLPEPCIDSTLSYCPTMDLVAVATESGVTVFRLNGQRVFGITNGNGKDAWMVVNAGLTWNSNGQFLAIAGSDSIVRLVNVFSGKIVHQLASTAVNAGGSAAAEISNLSWSPYFANVAATQRQLDAAGDDVSLDDLLGFNPQFSTLLKVKADLPRALGELDVESSLPKLATLPSTGGDDDVFSTRTSIDAIFHSKSRGPSEMLDVLLTAYEDQHATVNVKIFSSFEIGDVQLSSSIPSSNAKLPSKVVQQASHPFLPVHFLLVQRATSLHLLRLDLNFIPQTSPHYLPILATKATQLGNLLRYLSQIESQLSHEIKVAFDLPSRYLNNVSESIQQQNPDGDLRTEIWHLICTGECSEVMREWLADEVGDRGVKRWEKGVGDALEVVRRGVSECVLPCLERMYFVLSRLEGLSMFSKSRKVLGLDEKMIVDVRGTVDVVSLLSNDLLKTVGDELRAFESFMKWFKGEVEVQGMELGSERREELSAQRADEIDVKTVLGYVDGGLARSNVLDFLRGGSKDEKSIFMAEAHAGDDETQFYESYKSLRRKAIEKKMTSHNHLPKLDELVQRLQGQCAKVFEQIATTLKKSIGHAHVTTLNTDCSPECVAMRLIAGEPISEKELSYEVLIATKTSKSPQKVLLTRLEGSGSALACPSATNVPMQFEGEVIDLQFIDDLEFMVLVAGKHGSAIYKCAVTDQEAVLVHRFEDQQRQSRPKKLEINGRKGRRVVCVLDQDGMRYEIFDIDGADGEHGENGEEENGEEAMVE